MTATWKYYWHDGSSWNEITRPAFPNPSGGSNLEETFDGNRVAGKLIDGSKYILEPEVLTYSSPMSFSWNFVSGALDMENTIKFIQSGGYYFRLVSDIPTGIGGDRITYEGKLNKVTVSKVAGTGQRDYKDIVVELEPLKVT